MLKGKFYFVDQSFRQVPVTIMVINQNHLFKIYPLISFLDFASFWAEIQTFEQHWTVEKKEKEGENKGSQNEFPPTEN